MIWPTLVHGAVGVYGLCLLAMAIALSTEPAPAASSDPAAAAIFGGETPKTNRAVVRPFLASHAAKQTGRSRSCRESTEPSMT